MMMNIVCVWWSVLYVLMCLFFFFKQKTAYEMRISDWSSDVCSSDLLLVDRRGVEIIDLDIGVRTHGMGQRPRILGELAGAERAHVVDALDRAGAARKSVV